MPIKVGTTSIKIPFEKAYVGNDLVYTSVLPTRTISYYGTATALPTTRRSMGYNSFNDCVWFAGGCQNFTQRKNDVLVYNSNLTQSTATNLSNACRSLSSAITDDYVFFFGGENGGTACNVYDENMTKQSSVPTISYARYDGTSCSVPDSYAMFFGGEGSSNTLVAIDCYSNTLTKVNVGTLPVGTLQFGDNGVTIGNYGVIAGGRDASQNKRSAVYAYDKNLTRIDATVLSAGRTYMMNAGTNKYAFFGGGTNSSNVDTDVVDVYDENLTKQTNVTMSSGRRSGGSDGFYDFALFAGGVMSQNTVDIFDNNLTRTAGTNLPQGKHDLATGVTGNYMLFAGGNNGSSLYSTVDVYEAS